MQTQVIEASLLLVSKVGDEGVFHIQFTLNFAYNLPHSTFI